MTIYVCFLVVIFYFKLKKKKLTNIIFIIGTYIIRISILIRIMCVVYLFLTRTPLLYKLNTRLHIYNLYSMSIHYKYVSPYFNFYYLV